MHLLSLLAAYAAYLLLRPVGCAVSTSANCPTENGETYTDTSGDAYTLYCGEGTIGFPTAGHKDARDVDAKAGDYMTVPVRALHKFDNPFDEEARFVCTFTPAFYVNYLKLLSELRGDGPMTP